MNNIQKHKQITDSMHEIYKIKNEAYGDSFTKSFERYGPVSAMVRMSDKWHRLESLLIDNNDNKVDDESVTDTLIDLANYCIMLKMEMEDVANTIGTNKQAISRYERGDSNPKQETWQKLAEYFDVSDPYLLGFTDNNSKTIVEFGQWLKEIRKENKLTLIELSEKMGYSNAYLCQIENGKKNNYPSPKYLEIFSECMNADYVQLLTVAGYHDLARGVKVKQSEVGDSRGTNLEIALFDCGLDKNEVFFILNTIQNLKDLRDSR